MGTFSWFHIKTGSHIGIWSLPDLRTTRILLIPACSLEHFIFFNLFEHLARHLRFQECCQGIHCQLCSDPAALAVTLLAISPARAPSPTTGSCPLQRKQ
eukprot:1526024-Prymnesium_polylepis.1